MGAYASEQAREVVLAEVTGQVHQLPPTQARRLDVQRLLADRLPREAREQLADRLRCRARRYGCGDSASRQQDRNSPASAGLSTRRGANSNTQIAKASALIVPSPGTARPDRRSLHR